jgi:hypothetical protein
VIHTGGGNLLIIPDPMPRALEARGGLRHADLAGADGGRGRGGGLHIVFIRSEDH